MNSGITVYMVGDRLFTQSLTRADSNLVCIHVTNEENTWEPPAEFVIFVDFTTHPNFHPPKISLDVVDRILLGLCYNRVSIDVINTVYYTSKIRCTMS